MNTNGKEEHPLVSVVTPSLNQKRFIEETIKSVLSQDYPNVEYIVVDGGSTDAIVDVLKKYSDQIKWLSEPDAGQADAVNKGFKIAKGVILGWLNSDDIYLPGTLAYVGEYFANHPDVDVVYGDAYYVDQNGAIIRPYRTLDYSWESLAHECYICQPTVFFRRRVLDRVGHLNVKLRLALDYEFWIRIFRQYPPARLPRFLATSRMYADNKTLSLRRTAYREIVQIVRRHYGFVPYRWVLGYASYLWHRNDQFADPKHTAAIVVLLTFVLMAWYNRSNPCYLLRWITSKEYGMRAEVFRRMRKAEHQKTDRTEQMIQERTLRP